MGRSGRVWSLGEVAPVLFSGVRSVVHLRIFVTARALMFSFLIPASLFCPSKVSIQEEIAMQLLYVSLSLYICLCIVFLYVSFLRTGHWIVEISAQYSKHNYVSTVALVLVKQPLKIMEIGSWSYHCHG